MLDGLLLMITMFAAATPSAADACDMALIYQVVPDPSATWVLARITGYGEVKEPIASIGRAPSLIVTLKQGVAGLTPLKARQIVPLSFGPGCGTLPMSLDQMSRLYPIGAEVAVFSPMKTQSSADVIPVELSRGGHVAVVPAGAVRTPDGDLDFSLLDPHDSADPFPWFEYQRSVRAISRLAPNRRFVRLLNVAYFSGLRYSPGGPAYLDKLVAEARLTTTERDQIRKVFESMPR